jgi:hypothetical protein
LARKISFLFFIVFGAWCFIGSLYNVVEGEYITINWRGALIAFIFLAAFGLQYRHKLKNLDLILGCVCLLVSLYLILAIGDDYFDWLRGEDHYHNPGRYFGLWFTIVLSMNVMSGLMIWSDGKVKEKVV